MSPRISWALPSLALATFCGAAQAQTPAAAPPPAPFTLTSPAFKDGELMPAKYGDIRLTNNVNTCGPDAAKVSPALAWANPSDRAQTYAVMMLDVDAGLGASHFVAYDIPKAKLSLAEGELLDPKGFVAGKNYRAENYSGPCPPAGPAHHYVITLIATDLAPGTLKPGLTRDELLAALNGHNVGTASLIAKYGR